MCLFLILVLLCLCSNWADAVSPCGTNDTTNRTNYNLGYYWRDYFGVVPLDAFSGGLDESGHPTYIGQAYIEKYELLPGTIYSGCNKLLTSAYDFEATPDKNIKILCSNMSNKLKWVPAKKGEHHLLKNCHIVPGGSEIGLTISIGRVNYNGQTIVGKAFGDDAPNSGLWIPGVYSPFESYELLTYNCHRSFMITIV